MEQIKLSDLSEDAYSPQMIFDQVWEAPYEWFGLTHPKDKVLPAWVDELEYPDGFRPKVVRSYMVTAEEIEKAAFQYFYEYIIKNDGSRKLSAFVEDMDANDVDAILQLAIFGEVRYS